MDFEEIAYPAAMYRDRFRAEHARNTEEAFEKLAAESGVDPDANAALVKEIRKREKRIDSLKSKLSRWKFLRTGLVLLIVAGLVGITLYIFQLADDPLIDYQLPLWAAGVCGGVVILFFILILRGLNPKIRTFKSSLDEQNKQLLEDMDKAWAQMTPLNRLFQWDTIQLCDFLRKI